MKTFDQPVTSIYLVLKLKNIKKAVCSQAAITVIFFYICAAAFKTESLFILVHYCANAVKFGCHLSIKGMHIV